MLKATKALWSFNRSLCGNLKQNSISSYAVFKENKFFFCTDDPGSEIVRRRSKWKEKLSKLKNEHDIISDHTGPFIVREKKAMRAAEKYIKKEISSYEALEDKFRALASNPNDFSVNVYFNLYYAMLRLLQTEKYRSCFIKSTNREAFNTFFVEFGTKLKELNDSKHSIAVFNMNIPRCIFQAYPDFLSSCVEQIVNDPKTPKKEILSNLPTISAFYQAIKCTGTHGLQLKKIYDILYIDREAMNFQTKIALMNTMRSTQVFSDMWLDYLLYYFDANQKHISIDDSVAILHAVVGNKKMMPYELLVITRTKIIDNFNKLSLRTILKVMIIYARSRLSYNEILYEKIITHLKSENTLNQASLLDCVLALFYYSKMRYNDEKFRDLYLQRIMTQLKNLDDLQTKLLFLTLADINYTDLTTFELIFEHINVPKIINKLEEEETLSEAEKIYFKNIVESIEKLKAERLIERETEAEAPQSL